jgi:serine/threonine-protein kinase
MAKGEQPVISAMETTTSDLAGTVLEGAYRLVRLIGRGGMGAVYEAIQLRLNKRVAVKLMSREAACDMVSLERFRREAEITSKLGHPHLVNLVDFGTAESGQPYLVMEYLEGEDLDQRLQKAIRMPVDIAARIVTQSASALGAAHAQDVVHRDLKPANIFLLQVPGEPEFVKVLDFGISKVKVANGRRLTGVQSVVGTPAYMSPEQATGRSEETDHRADQWALACIAWEVLCGHPPFMADDTTALFFQILRIEPPSLTKQVPELQPAAEAVLRRALSKHHTDRYPSIRDFARAFELAALGHFTESTPAPMILPRPTDSGGFRAAGKTPPEQNLATDDEPTTIRDSAGRSIASPQPTARVPRFKHAAWRFAPLAVAALVALMALGALLLRTRAPTATAAPNPPPLPQPRIVSLPSNPAAVPSSDPTAARTETSANEPLPRAGSERPPRARFERKPTSRMVGKARPSPANARNKHRLFEEL